MNYLITSGEYEDFRVEALVKSKRTESEVRRLFTEANGLPSEERYIQRFLAWLEESGVGTVVPYEELFLDHGTEALKSFKRRYREQGDPGVELPRGWIQSLLDRRSTCPKCGSERAPVEVREYTRNGRLSHTECLDCGVLLVAKLT